jgi:thymidylate synthase
MENTFDTQYKELIQECIKEGFQRPTISGVDAKSILGVSISHSMKNGFPLSTLRKMPERSIRVETEFYLQGYTDKRWLTDRGCNFWNEWNCEKFEDPNDLGATYGFEWRNFGADYYGLNSPIVGSGVDQIKWVIQELKKNPDSKRIIVSQWNPKDIEIQPIPPCPFAFQLLKYGSELNLIFYQRSGDLCLGFPNDFAQHALLLHLFCKELNYNEGRVIGMFGQIEMYVNHEDQVKELLKETIYDLPKVKTNNFGSVLDWKYIDTVFENYNHGKTRKFDIAV